jgi:hypothetical protein
MPGKNDGVVGSSIVGRWIEAYERALGREKELKEQIRKIDLLLEEAKKARYLIDTEKMQQQKRDHEDELKAVQQKRLKLEWMAIDHIKNGDWDPEVLTEYSFVRDLLLLDRIREEQTREICRNCKECQIIRVKTDKGETPLEMVVKPEKACSFPYVPYYRIREIWETKKQLQVTTKPLGPLTPDEKREVEKWISQRLTLYRNLLHSFIEEDKRVIHSRKLLYRGCARKLPKILPIIREKEIREEDGDPKAPDHFSEDITAEISEDGSYTKVYISSKHGSEESE